VEDAGRAVTEIMHSGIIPSVLEILDNRTIEVIREHGKVELPEAQAMILVETDGYTETEASFQMEKVMEVFRANKALSVQTANSPEEVAELWRARKTAGSVASTLGTNNVSEDVAVPMSRVPELLTGISAIVEKHGLPFVIYGHAGDGNLHPKIMYNRSDPDHAKGVCEAVGEIFRLTCDLEGTITGEHGVGLAKAPYMAMEHEEVALEVMKNLKRLFDPNNILNPGKMNLDP
jgi:glycolate oxidase